jgi:uncharacterized protein YxeA
LPVCYSYLLHLQTVLLHKLRILVVLLILACLGTECVVAAALYEQNAPFLTDSKDGQESKEDPAKEESEEKEEYKVKSQAVYICPTISTTASTQHFCKTEPYKEVYHSLPEIPPELL